MKKLNLERLSQIAVILIAVFALFVSIYQVKLAQKHNKLSVEPYLDYDIIQVDSILEVSFSNHGFGPAILKKLTFEFEGAEYKSLEAFLKGSGEIKNRLGSYNYSENSIIANGAENHLVKLKGATVRGVNVLMIYETIYKEQREFRFRF